jgi:AbrB family looped-hinge helix DNA binding protein
VPTVFRVKLGKTGNSLKITVPRPIVEGFGWDEGDEIELLVTDSEIVLKRINGRSKRGRG